MRLSHLLQRLSRQELRNQPGGGGGSGLVDEDRIPEFVQYVNEGLRRLYSRFVIHEKTLLVRQVLGRTSYPLDRRFAVHGHVGTKGAPCYFIEDTACAPFLGDLILVTEAYDQAGCSLRLNDTGVAKSVFLPKWNLLEIPNPVEGRLVSLTYQAEHPPLCEQDERGTQVVLDQWIELPGVLEKALQKFVASEYFMSLDSEGASARSDKLLAGVEAICGEVEQKDLIGQTYAPTTDKLRDKGFV